MAAWSGSIPGGSLNKCSAGKLDLVRPSSGAAQQDGAIAGLEFRRAALDDFAAAFDARHRGQLRLHAVGSLDEVQVRGIQRSGQDSQADFAV
jgi:hypothetical protein